ncbi:MAG: transporter [Pseudoxanthomonas sp.]
MPPSHRCSWHRRGAALIAAILPLAAAAEEIAFDRPGIPFAPQTLGRGGFAWEQSLPEVSWDRVEGGIQREYVAGSVLRFGVGASVELQVLSDAQAWRRDTGRDALRGHGRGSTALAAKIALPSPDAAFSWALLAQADIESGSASYGNEDHVRALALSAKWDFSQARALTLYVQGVDSRAGHSWTIAPNYTFLSGASWQAYVEAGVGHGEDSTRGVGGGVAWMMGEHAQLDISLLRGTASDAPDWQGGLGLSVGFQ